MFSPIENGTSIDVQGLNCRIPTVGYVLNSETKEYEYRGVYSRSDNPKEQKWERKPLPIWFKETLKRWKAYDKKRKEDEPEFYDEQLEAYKKQEWDRRLNGFWFMNYNPSKGESEPIYLTGSHYMYLQWWQLDIGYPKYRIPDLEYFYFLQYCIEDPDCMGMLEITKRRFGKTFRGGLFLYEYITRTKMTNGAIQSKTGKDAKKVFSKAVISPFKKLPKFFRPEYDASLGITPKTEIRFQQTNVRGSKAEDGLDKEELGSMIDHGSADPIEYDGQKIHRGFEDEWAKCFGKGTQIRMYDGSIKNVEDVVYNDLVMGEDSTPRIASGITKGVEMMYEVVPNKGKGFKCNASHILTLSVSDRFKYNGITYLAGDAIELTVREYIDKLPTNFYKRVALYRTGWELPEHSHLISPYMFGVWLGDGNSRDFSITSIDKEVIQSVNEFASEHGLRVREKEDKISYHVTSNTIGVNHVTAELRRLTVLKNKHIPKEYLIDSRENRLQLLAGLIDTDGYSIFRKGYCSGMEITQKRKELAYNIHELATSLGFFSSIRERKSTMKRKDETIYSCPVYKVLIYGDVDLIPNRVERKKAIISRTKNRRNPLKTGFTINSLGKGQYFGFKVDRNNLFLLADGTVVHNTIECNIYDRHEVLRYCVQDDEGRIIGKLLYSSTVEKLDTDREGIQESAKLLWNDSDQLKKQANGRTASGLYRFFMTADRARNFDDYGFPDVEKTIREILADRDTVKHNPRSLTKRIKKEARTIEEAFSDDEDGCIFNIININKQKAYLKNNPITHWRYLQFYRRLDTQKVDWRDVDPDRTELCWKIISLPPNGEENKHRMDMGMMFPDRQEIGVIGVDGYSNTQGGKQYGSKLAGWMFIKFDIRDPENTGLFAGHIYGRPNEKDDMHNQILLGAEYFGFPVYYEFVADDYYTYFKNRGRLGYLPFFPKNAIDPVKLKEDPDGKKRHRGFPTTEFALTKQNDAMTTFVEHHYDKILYEELLDDLPKFRPFKRGPHDRTVSAMITLVSSLEPVHKFTPPKDPLVKMYGEVQKKYTNPALAEY
jgi:hypothetical protein